MIYLKLRGRIGNQLFMYATAREIQLKKGNVETLIIDDWSNRPEGYVNSLVEYDLPNVKYVDKPMLKYRLRFLPQLLLNKCVEKKISKMNYNDSNMYEKKKQSLFNRMGMFRFTNGFVEYPNKFRRDTYVDGYFQSEHFFEDNKKEIKELFSIDSKLMESNYPNLEQIQTRNSVCISIKVEHNAGNSMYDVCDVEYYKKAISYIQENVDNPLFFVCSDNVEYVKNNLIDISKYDVVEQSKNHPVHITLSAMSKCKHFIIGNSSYAWWAQYLSEYENKIVVAPSKWYGVDAKWQWDLYMDNWVKIEV